MKNNLKDKKVLFTLLLATVLILLHSWQFVKSDFRVEPLVNLVMVCVYIPVVLIFGFNCLSFFLLVYSFVWIPFESFENFTSLFLLCSAISLNRKLSVCFIPYIIETIMCYMLKGMQISHIAITSVYILFFFQIYIFILKNHAEFRPLELKPEEEKILQELAQGKMQKEITFYSHVTVSKKLKDARERNNCISTDELVTKYKSINQIN